MNLKMAFATAWKDLKGALAKADAYLTNNLPKIQAGVKEAEAVAVAADPALAPVVTTFDTFEEALVGEVATAIHEGSAIVNSSGETTVTLSAELSSAIKSLVGTLQGHPAVLAAGPSITIGPVTTSGPVTASSK